MNDNLNKVDLVALKGDDPVVRLVALDDLDWINELCHLTALQEKLNTYLAFVESGQLSKQFPESIGKRVRIELIFQHSPYSANQHTFLAKANQVITDAGFEFSWSVRA